MDSAYRKYHLDPITFSFMYAWSENFILVLSHDEVVHGKVFAAEQNAGRLLAEIRRAARALGYFMGPSREKAAVQGAENSASLLSGNIKKAWTGIF